MSFRFRFPRSTSRFTLPGSLACAAIAALTCPAKEPPPTLAADIASFTGSRTRVAWVQDMGSGGDEQCEGKKLRLMALDTSEGGATERPLVPTISNYYRPLITRSGDRVIYTNWIENRVFVVNWDGTGLHEIAQGSAEAAWRDPRSGVEWVYVRTGFDKKKRPGSGTVVERFQVDHPENKEIVWRNRTQPLEDFQLSADGLRATAAIPWPDAGVADLAKGTIIHELGNGCWPAMSPDNSYRCWVFDGSHRSVRMYQPGAKNSWNVVVNDHPNLSKGEVYHPRWSNHPRFICATGPYARIKDGGNQVDAYIGKFDPEFRHIEKWLQVTWSDRANFYPDVWIESAAKSPAVDVARSTGKTPAATEPVKPVEDRKNAAVFLWESGSKQGKVLDPESGEFLPAVPEARGMALFGRNRELDVSRGSFVVKNADEPLLKTLVRHQELSIEAAIIPRAARTKDAAQILTYSSTAKSRNFSLSQDGDQITFRIRTTQTGQNALKPVLQLGRLHPGKPNHIVVTFQSGRVVCYLNGEKSFDGTGPKGDLSNWSEQHLVIGDEWNAGTAAWDGKVETVALYDRVLGLTEALERYDHFTERVRGRKPVGQFVVRAKLVSATPAPSPESIAPYRRALVVHDYEVQKVLSGRLDARKIQVAHWGVLDAKILASDTKVGSTYELTLEKFSDQPQLEGERLVSESSEFGLDLFLALEARPAAGAGASRR